MVQVIILAIASTSVCLILETIFLQKKKVYIYVKNEIFGFMFAGDGNLDHWACYACCFPGIGLC